MSETTYGVEVGRVRAEEIGDARDLLLRPPDQAIRPVVTIFEREGAGATDIAPAVAKRLGVAYIEQRFSSDQVAEADTQQLVRDSNFDRWLRTVSYTGTQDADLARALDVAEDHSIAEQNRAEVMEFARGGAH